MSEAMGGVLLVGGGGHCRSVLDALFRMAPDARVGIIDRNPDAACFGVPVVGTDGDLFVLRAAGYTHAMVTVGSVGDASLRRRLAANIDDAGLVPLTVIDPSAVVSGNAQLGRGVFAGKGAIINAGAVIGDHVILNTGCIVEHDTRVDAFAHIASGAALCGGVLIGEGTHIGARSVVIQQVQVGRETLIGAGSVVLRDVPERCVAYGDPCKVRKQR